ncbi:MAG: hypothetical protein M4D80_28980 [Myxococcota bacterium]|nr:hypothetical protein [Deltaproteobacteria bacterium]MDQ3339216.1 hypothetical protein [Myxococcota bacterium]
MRIRWAFVFACACGGGGSSPIDAAIPPAPRQVVATVPATINRNLDLLFVIDDTEADRQTDLAANLPSFIDALNTVEGGLPDVHIGVVTTDMGTKSSSGAPAPPVGVLGQGGCADAGKDGKLITNGAPLSVGATFLSDIRQTDGTRLKNYTGSLTTVLGQMVRPGATGCGFEQPLHAMKRAFENTAANAGFLRPDAKLGIIFLMDEDDCSAKSAELFAPDSTALGPRTSFRCTRFGVTCQVGGKTPDEMNVVGDKSNCDSNPTSTLLDDSLAFASVVRGLKTDPRGIFVAGMMGNPTPFAVEERQIDGMAQLALRHSCQFNGTTPVADPAVRMQQFLDEFPSSSFHSICTNDHAASLANIGQLATTVVGNACITRSLAMPLDCVVEDDTGAMKTTIPPCGSPETAPCWKIDIDPTACPSAQNQKLVIVRSSAPAPSTIATMRCKL